MTALTVEQKRVKIAEAKGWTVRQWVDRKGNNCFGLLPPGADKSSSAFKRPPDYFGDLNACHEALSGLTDEQHGPYRAKLAAVVTGRKDTATHLMSRSEYRAWFSAKPAQIAEAIGLTLGLWEAGQ